MSGGTGTGKTTLLASLLSLVGPDERMVLVEDSGELRPEHPHVVALEARPPNIEGAGEVTVRTLVRQALRMRPDRLVVGEVRGGEVIELLAALNTGHEGGCGTLHANSAADVPARVEALALAADLGREAAHSQLASGRRRGAPPGSRADGVRVLREVAVPRGTRRAGVMRPAVSFGDDGGARAGAGADRARPRGWGGGGAVLGCGGRGGARGPAGAAGARRLAAATGPTARGAGCAGAGGPVARGLVVAGSSTAARDRRWPRPG